MTLKLLIYNQLTRKQFLKNHNDKKNVIDGVTIYYLFSRTDRAIKLLTNNIS